MNATVSIAGVTPVREFEPDDRRQLASIVRELAQARRTFAFVGGGTDLDFGNAPRPLEAVIRTTKLCTVLDYSPEDQTITVEGGMRLAELDAVLAEAGQMLPVDVADRAHATVGGAIATNAFGARRHRYGSIKDLIVGIDIVRPDGTLARGGGKVVKNVAGFDLPKLMVGSLGTLGAVVSATLRVFPIAQTTRAVVIDASVHDAGVIAALGDRAIDPTAVMAMPDRGIVLIFTGLEASVAAQVERVGAVVAAHATGVVELDADGLERTLAREREIRGRGTWRATIAGAITTRIPDCCPPGADRVSYPTFGVTIASSTDEPFAVDAVERARAAGNVIFHAMPGRARADLDAWGPPPPSFALMSAIKTQFDPHGLCNPGRFIGGL